MLIIKKKYKEYGILIYYQTNKNYTEAWCIADIIDNETTEYIAYQVLVGNCGIVPDINKALKDCKRIIEKHRIWC